VSRVRGNRGLGRRRDWWWLTNPHFQLGFGDFRADAPWGELPATEARLYEIGRLFAAHCQVEGRLPAALPRPRTRRPPGVPSSELELELLVASYSSIPRPRR
jgi:hypothetical protein